ncbi:MAG: RibD family protein [Microbacterium sp.]
MHRRRSEADAIIVGIGTVLADDPRSPRGSPTARCTSISRAPSSSGSGPCPTAPPSGATPPLLHRDGENLGGESPNEPSLMTQLRDEGIHRVFVEGGPTIASAFLRAGLADELLVYVAPTLLGYGPGDADHPRCGASASRRSRSSGGSRSARSTGSATTSDRRPVTKEGA